MAPPFPTTSDGYIVLPATSKLRLKGQPKVNVRWAAIVGIQRGTQRLSLAQATVLQANRVVRGNDQPEIGASILLYLAQIGFWPLGRREHVRWPPIGDEHDRRHWRRPYIWALTLEDYRRRILPATDVDLDDTNPSAEDRARGINVAIQRLKSMGPFRGDEDEWLSSAVQWYRDPFDYPDANDARLRAVLDELVHLTRQWALAPNSRPLSEALAAWIRRKATDRDREALGVALKMIKQGHRLTHEAIRRHQRLALEGLSSGGTRWAELLAEGGGLHDLFYKPMALFGFETWQFTARPDGILRITLPETVNIGWLHLGRVWLDSLMLASARREGMAVNKHLDELRWSLGFLASNPEALLMNAELTHPTLKLDDADKGQEDGKRGLADETAPEKAFEQKAFIDMAREVLKDHFPQCWEAFYHVRVLGYSGKEVAEKLGVSRARVSQLVQKAERLLAQDPRLKDWLAG